MSIDFNYDENNSNHNKNAIPYAPVTLFHCIKDNQRSSSN